jgi:hypothetical protein
MKKTKKTKADTALDQIATRLRAALRRETTNVIELGKLLIESRKHLDHGEWQVWLAENFDLSYRTALRYVSAAEYVAKSDTVAHFANLSASVLYQLAEGCYDEREEAAILANAHERRVDEDAAKAICKALAPPDDGGEDDDQEDGGDDAEDPEIAAILDGPPPAVPPPAPNPPPTDYALRDFDRAISALNRLKTKPTTHFEQTIHSANDLKDVESFIHAVMRAHPQAMNTKNGDPK